MAPEDWTYMTVQGYRFYFKYQPGLSKRVAHITYKHGCTAFCAVIPWIQGRAPYNSIWHLRHARYEFTANNHSIYWDWIDEERGYVRIITCLNLINKEDCPDAKVYKNAP